MSLTGSVNLNGGGSGEGYVPVTKSKKNAIDGEEGAARQTTTNSGGNGAGYHQSPRSDVQEVFLFTLHEPFKGALAKLMGLLEQVNNIPHDVRIAIVSGPLGYMSNIRSVRPTPFMPTPTLLRPLIR
ncbi:MAG: hypothetical protein H7338_16560 [Candidatus Sericytochromatia bacterium]|nr:hypothetical protein [Candidatus Sericytochromatia bacterium]